MAADRTGSTRTARNPTGRSSMRSSMAPQPAPQLSSAGVQAQTRRRDSKQWRRSRMSVARDERLSARISGPAGRHLVRDVGEGRRARADGRGPTGEPSHCTDPTSPSRTRMNLYLHVAWRMLHVVWRMLHVAWRMLLYVVWRMLLHVVWRMLHTARCTL
jgi:hypothetical protein